MTNVETGRDFDRLYAQHYKSLKLQGKRGKERLMATPGRRAAYRPDI